MYAERPDVDTDGCPACKSYPGSHSRGERGRGQISLAYTALGQPGK